MGLRFSYDYSGTLQKLEMRIMNINSLTLCTDQFVTSTYSTHPGIPQAFDTLASPGSSALCSSRKDPYLPNGRIRNYEGGAGSDH